MSLRFAPYMYGSYAPPSSGAPGAPTTPVATGGNASATVVCAATTNGGSPITTFTATSSPGNIQGTSTTGTTAVAGLSNGTPYTFTVTATNAHGTSPASAPSNSVTPAATAPAAPVIGTATPGNASAMVAFTAGDNGGSAITSFTATSSPGGLTGSGASSPVTVAGLTNGTNYTFTVTATNAIGTSSLSAASNSVSPSGNSSAPGQVTNLQILFQGMSSAGQGTGRSSPAPIAPNTQAIGWTQAVQGTFAITQNKIYRSTNGGAFSLLATIAAATSYTDTTATGCLGSTATPHNAQGQNWPANGYLYKVSAVDSQGTEGAQSLTQIFVIYKNGQQLAMGGDYNNSMVSTYTDTTGIAGNPFGSTQDLLNVTQGGNGQWLPYAGKNATQWNIWCGYGSPAQVFAYLNLSINPSKTGQTFNCWIEYRTDVNGDPGSQPGISNVGNSAALYGPATVAGTWATYKLPLSLLMKAGSSDPNVTPGSVQGMFYKFGINDNNGGNLAHWFVDNMFLSPS